MRTFLLVGENFISVCLGENIDLTGTVYTGKDVKQHAEN